MTPTNEAGHGLPELPATRLLHMYGADFIDVYTADQMRQYARDALALSRGVPADMVLVPRKLTSDMADAYMRLFTGTERFSAERMWDGLLAAAPAAAGAQGEDAGSAVIRASLQKVIDAVGAYLPPDGISQEDLISLVIEATDNPEIVRAMK